MGQRMTRINELIKREINDILRTQFRNESVAYTIIDIEISPDLRNGNVFYSVLGDDVDREKAVQFFKRNAKEIRFQVGKRVTIKYLPFFRYRYDDSMARGAQLVELLEEVDPDTNE
jgi:ribosome-binding factor A